jgi:predicted O-methyltransferase YrrM
VASFAETWSRVRDIDGWLTEGQAQVLYDVAINVGPGDAIVEIGSHHGRSTVILATAKPAGTKLLAVDPYGDPRWGGGEESLAIFQANLAKHGVDQDVQLARQLGAEAGNAWLGGPVGLLFVDGAHDYPSVSADLQAWLSHMSTTGTILMHDAYSSPGVTQAAFRHMFAARDYAYVGSSRSLIAFTCSKQHGAARALSGARMLTKLPWMARNLAIKVAYAAAGPRYRHCWGIVTRTSPTRQESSAKRSAKLYPRCHRSACDKSSASGHRDKKPATVWISAIKGGEFAMLEGDVPIKGLEIIKDLRCGTAISRQSGMNLNKEARSTV